MAHKAQLMTLKDPSIGLWPNMQIFPFHLEIIVNTLKYIQNFDKGDILDNNILSWEAHLNLNEVSPYFLYGCLFYCCSCPHTRTKFATYCISCGTKDF